MKREEFDGYALNRFVGRLTRHSRLDTREIEALSSLTGKIIRFRAGTDFERMCPESQQVGLVAQGIVARFEDSEDGGRQDSAVFVSGDMFGLHRFAFPQTKWSLTAFTSCTVLFIPLEEMQQLATRHPALERAFWRDMAIDASIAAKWIGNFSLRSGPGTSGLATRRLTNFPPMVESRHWQLPPYPFSDR